MRLILASSSPSRREIVSKLGYLFESVSPDIDETRHPGESVKSLVERLSYEKAQVVENHLNPESGALIIGSDTVADLNNQVIGKPHQPDQAMALLRRMSDQVVRFYSGLCLIEVGRSVQITHDVYEVHFKTLDDQTIEHYLNWEKPYALAGGFKSEGMGVVLAKSYSGTDPNTLMGLPLIRLVEWLNAKGWICPGPPSSAGEPSDPNRRA